MTRENDQSLSDTFHSPKNDLKQVHDPDGESPCGAGIDSLHRELKNGSLHFYNQPLARKKWSGVLKQSDGTVTKKRQWTPPPTPYPILKLESERLKEIIEATQVLPRYEDLEAEARANDTLVTLPILDVGDAVAFLENTAHQTVSVETKGGSLSYPAKMWQLRCLPRDALSQRLRDGYSVCFALCDRYGPYIRRGPLWYAADGMIIDCDEFRTPEKPDRPEPVYSREAFFEQYPQLLEYASFLMPSTRSLLEGNPFKGRAVIPFPETVTDKRLFHAIGDYLCDLFGFLPKNVTKNPIAVAFGAKHQAAQAWRGEGLFPQSVLDSLKQQVIEKEKQRKAEAAEREQARQQREQIRVDADRIRSQLQARGHEVESAEMREPISTFIEQVDPVSEMCRLGWLTQNHGAEYHWGGGSVGRSCEIVDGRIKIFSATMAAASPENANEPVNAHRFLLYNLYQLDITQDADKRELRCRLADDGYGTHPDIYEAEQQRLRDAAVDEGLLTEEKRYQIDTEHIHEVSDIDTERDGNRQALQDWIQKVEGSKTKELLLIGSAAGTGKTTVAITTAERMLYIAKTTEEADQVYQKLFEAEEDAIRHRPRLFNRGHTDFDGNPDWETLPLGLGEQERPCINPDACNLHAERGHPTHEVCIRCPLYSECQADGYLSQDSKERNAQKVVYAWDEIVACDEIHAPRVKRICTADDIFIVDEVNPANLTQHRLVTRNMLYDLTERFRDINTRLEYQALKPLLDLQSTAETPQAFIDGLQAHLETLGDISELDTKLEKFPVGYVFQRVEGESYNFKATLHYRGKEVTVPVVSWETHEDTPVFELQPDTPITVGTWQLSFFPLSFLIKVGLASLDDPPRCYNNFLSDMQTFIDEHPNIENAPFSFDPKKQVFEFHLKPTLNHHRAIFLTASDPDNLISEAYRETDVNITRHTGTPPAWKTDLVFQLSTGNYLPRQSLIRRSEDGTLRLKPRAQQLIDDYILPSVNARLQVLVVAPKAFQECPELDALKRRANVELINHHHAEGRNDYQDFDIVFIFHYEPEHHSVQQTATRIYRNPETPLDFTRAKRTVTFGGVSFEKVVYVDERVQAVYHRECRARLMQSAMRLRPNLHEDKIIVFLTAEPVDIPVTPVPFSLADKNDFAGDWKAFGEKIQAKAEAIETGDVQDVQDKTGLKKSQAYELTKESRQQNKATRDAEICSRYASGESKASIARSLGIHRNTIDTVLSKTDF